MEALEYYEKQILCPCCGIPREIAHDKKGPPMGVTVVRCQAGRALAIAQRDRHQNSLPPRERKKGWKPGQAEPGDGLLWSVAPVDPDPMEVPADD